VIPGDARLAIVAFAVGVALCQQFAELPQAHWYWLTPAGLLALYFRPLRLFAAVGLGLLWAAWRAELILAQALPPQLERKDVEIIGVIDAIPQTFSRRVRFTFAVESLHFNAQAYPSPGRIRLSWYTNEPPDLRVGQRWQFSARLRRPHAMLNPGAFDYSAWLFSEHIRAVGYVRKQAELLAEAGPGNIQSWREDLLANLTRALSGHASTALIAALALGERQGMSDSQWEVLRLTGTTHLMAISGLHIGWIAVCGFWLGRRLGSLHQRWLLSVPKQYSGALFALVVAFFYALLAGFAIPTQRAFIMIATLIVSLLLGRSRSLSHSLALALLLVLLWSPLAVLSPGLWLSFGAVATILYVFSGRLKIPWGWAKIHVIVILGLSPVLLAWFGQIPLLSPLANLIAVPWVGFLVVPEALLGTLLTGVWPGAAQWLLDWSAWNLELLWVYLEALSQYDWGILERPPAPAWALVCAVIGMAWLLAPAGFPGRWIGLIWLLPALFLPRATPPAGHVWFTLLEVGQGLAAIVQTPNHVLVYDTGPYFSPRFDAGSDIIAPILRAQGIYRIDRLVVSHEDNDHAGGAKGLRETMPVTSIMAGMPETLADAQACHGGQSWTWDGIRFDMLHPPADNAFLSDNNRSCVLKVSTDGASLLLTGDIGKDMEADLIAQFGAQLRADIIVAPHHGSRTSSSQAFVETVQARYVLFSTGYLNRFGFPKPDVVARYQAAGASALNTPQTGAIRVELTADGVAPPHLSRVEDKRYWHE
jgi:competence protein ComEC